MADRAYTTAELEAAVAALTDPARLRTAQDVVTRTAPALQQLLTSALQDGGWFDAGHEQAVREVSAREDPDERLRELRTLLAEETRLGMLVGVAVGFELAHELEATSPPIDPSAPAPPQPSTEALDDAAPQRSTEALDQAAPEPSTEALDQAAPEPSTEALDHAPPQRSTEALDPAPPQRSTGNQTTEED